MELIIRPFQSIDPTATTRVTVVADPKVTITPGHLCWGSVGTLPTAIEQTDTFDGVNFRLEECDEHLAEDTRDTEKVKITQAGVPENFVIYERARKINFKKTNKGKFLGVFHTETTDLDLPNVFSGSPFGDVPEQNRCKQSMYMKR